MPTATTEPEELRAGDTWAWRREDLTDYPAGTWSLRYRFANAASSFEVTATADGGAFAVAVAPETTATTEPGRYAWRAYVSDGTDRYTVGEGETVVLPDLEAVPAGVGVDTRSHAVRVLEAIEAVLERRATKDQMSMAIQGRQLSRTPIADLLLLRDTYRAEVSRERMAAQSGAGRARYFVRFARG